MNKSEKSEVRIKTRLKEFGFLLFKNKYWKTVSFKIAKFVIHVAPPCSLFKENKDKSSRKWQHKSVLLWHFC